MKLLVTGGAGFIGSALAKRLFSEGHEVVVIDNFNEYYDVELKRARQKEFLEGCMVLEGDIADNDFLSDVFQKHTFDVVCHVAAHAGVRYSIEHPEVYVESNVRGTQALLEAMKVAGVQRMVYASTSSVYGTASNVPFTEDMPADRPVSVYAATKRAGELLAHTYWSLYGIQTTCLRFFTVYGPWSRPDMAMLKFAQKMSAGESIDIYNNGDLRRDFTYIDDIVDGFVLAIEKPFEYEIFNLGHGSPVELEDFVAVLEKKMGIEAKKNMLPMQQGDVFETYADVHKAEEKLGFKTKVPFEEGVGRFVSWYKSYYTK